jgi:hypothetical protein
MIQHVTLTLRPLQGECGSKEASGKAFSSPVNVSLNLGILE